MGRILIIEDSFDDFEFYSRLLRKTCSARIDHCLSSEEALQVLGEGNKIEYDIILLDYNLPGMNGMDFLHEFMSNDNICKSPVIVLTGQGDEEAAVEFMKLKVSNYLNKGTLTDKILLDAINKAREQFECEKIEEKKQAERLLFAHTLAHDLKNPIVRIQAYARLAQKNQKNVGQYLQNIGADAEYLHEFISKLLSYAEFGRRSEQMKKIKLDQVIQKSMDLLEVPIKQKQAKIKVSFSSDDVFVAGSYVALIQLFQNLLSNSIKYCNKKPSIDIHWETTKNNVVVIIKDNGLGIPKAFSSKVFEPFFRIADNCGSKGTGLGLSIVKSIVEQHDASIKILHPTKGGTQFKISFPIVRDDAHLPLG